MIPAHLVFVNSDNLSGVKIWFTFAAVMVNDTPNLSTDFVKDMLAESPAKEPKAMVADRIPKLPKNVHWAVKAVVEPYLELCAERESSDKKLCVKI